MSTKSPPPREKQDAKPTRDGIAGGEGSSRVEPQPLVLRDESDAIVDDLKQQLADLQAQLKVQRARQIPPGEGDMQVGPGAADAGLTPHIASRMRIPAEQLAHRLESLLGEVDDPDLKAELEACHDTAQFLLGTFNRITDEHNALTDKLTADALVIDSTDLLERLEKSLHDRGWEVDAAAESALPLRLALATQSLLTVMATVVELADELFGRPVRLSVECPGAEGAGVGESCELVLRLACEKVWKEAPASDSVSMAVMQAGIRSPGMVDLLYVEKIIEMRGGHVGFLTLDGLPQGFEVRVPITVLDPVA